MPYLSYSAVQQLRRFRCSGGNYCVDEKQLTSHQIVPDMHWSFHSSRIPQEPLTHWHFIQQWWQTLFCL